jgi:predicted component of type VI protein secretion system
MKKYRNRKVTTSDGIEHDSKKEALRWELLKLKQEDGVIKNLRRQVEYILIPSQVETINGRVKTVERSVSYIADFVYTDVGTGKTVVEDSKGVRTREYIIKRKLMRYIHGINIQEV